MIPPPSPSVQWIHRQDVLINRGAEGKTGKAFVASMTEEKAMQLASKVVSEGFLYGVGHSCIQYREQKGGGGGGGGGGPCLFRALPWAAGPAGRRNGKSVCSNSRLSS